MIGHTIDRLVAAYPTQVEAAVDMVSLAAPWLLIGLAVWLLAVAGEWLIDWHERRCIVRAKRLRYRTADGDQMAREIEQLWRHTPDAKGASWEPWRDTMPPAEPAPRHKVRAGAPTVVAFPTANAERRRQS